MRLINDSIIQHIYKMRHAIQDVEDMLAHISEGSNVNPHRTVIPVDEKNGSVLYMPSSDGTNYGAVKVVSIFPENPSKQLPTTQGTILLTELTTGRHVALVAGSYLTRLRTGALSAISCKHLARTDSKILAVIGTGAMAFEQVLGIVEVLPIQKIYLVNRTTEKAEQFAERLEAYGVNAQFEVVTDADKAVSKADVVCCATRSTQDVFSASAVKPGTHIIGVGSYLPEMREIPVDIIPKAAAIYADDVEGVQVEAGEFIAAAEQGEWRFDDLSGALHELVGQEYKRNAKAITIFKSVGAAHFDLAVAKGVYRLAKHLGVGEDVEM
ncbi:ornithine cyclodeaminase family protein [Chryseomicrobium palamuruense]|uniref:Ornithine cyclodeaminase family protein n=1 Tax=Chryseomicrobium palamuruense TaxID=682973 RepID=A0ABV8UUR6_9BACL